MQKTGVKSRQTTNIGLDESECFTACARVGPRVVNERQNNHRQAVGNLSRTAFAWRERHGCHCRVSRHRSSQCYRARAPARCTRVGASPGNLGGGPGHIGKKACVVTQPLPFSITCASHQSPWPARARRRHRQCRRRAFTFWLRRLKLRPSASPRQATALVGWHCQSMDSMGSFQWHTVPASRVQGSGGSFIQRATTRTCLMVTSTSR